MKRRILVVIAGCLVSALCRADASDRGVVRPLA